LNGEDGFPVIKLSRPPFVYGASVFRTGVGIPVLIQASWPQEEQDRFLRTGDKLPQEKTDQGNTQFSPSTRGQQICAACQTKTAENKVCSQVPRVPGPKVLREYLSLATGEAPYTTTEKTWLKKHFGGEFKFLQTCGLGIYDDHDRKQGRMIARVLIEDEKYMTDHPAPDDADEPDHEFASHMSSDNEVDNEALPDPEDMFADPMAHVADFHFNDMELEFIEGKYGNTNQFMISFGLKFYDEDDCKEAKKIVEAMTSESDEESSISDDL
jgi:hypothetical protein